MLKLDIEGAEVPVLEDCADLLGNVDHLFVVIPFIYPSTSASDPVGANVIRGGFPSPYPEPGTVFSQSLRAY
ncbi:MAG: hypothetical protein HC880_14295 [Bacteroidia bacterium]|nr:hypothetical protein [Bacteroidia bacterium]